MNGERQPTQHEPEEGLDFTIVWCGIFLAGFGLWYWVFLS